MDDKFGLERFVSAQDAGGTYSQALEELRRGNKQSHWMWFTFPQLAGLGQSTMSQTYAIISLVEARAYLRHPVLGQRLLECTGTVASLRDLTAQQVFGSVDAKKLHSSMTLFALADPQEEVFRRVLAQYFHGEPDPATDRLLHGQD